MSFANHNILDIALSIIPSTVVQIRKNLGVKINKYGQSEAFYTDWIDVYGIVQPGSEQNEHTERIDFSKKHVSIWLRGIALDGTHIQWAPDQIRYVDRIFNVISIEDWFPYDNYRKCECVEALNIPQSQRSVDKTQAMQEAQTHLAGRRKVVPKSTDGQSVDNLKLFSMPQSQAKQETQTVMKEEQHKEDAGTDNTKSSIAKKDLSLVGKARIRF